MAQHDQPEFEEPALKAAVRRNFESERAPARLRERIVAQMVAGDGEPAGERARSWRLRLGPHPVRTLAAACIAVIAVSVAAYQVKTNFFPSTPTMTYTVQELPATFAMEMVKTHTSCAKLPDHHLVTGDDFKKLAEMLSAQVKVPVAALDLPGWTFKGAGACKVGSVISAHLVYANAQGQSVSVFSLPADAVYAAPDGATYSQTVEGHPLSGFKQGSGLYCVVGSSSGSDALSMKTVESLRDKLHACLPAVGCGTGKMGAVAER